MRRTRRRGRAAGDQRHRVVARNRRGGAPARRHRRTAGDAQPRRRRPTSRRGAPRASSARRASGGRTQPRTASVATCAVSVARARAADRRSQGGRLRRSETEVEDASEGAESSGVVASLAPTRARAQHAAASGWRREPNVQVGGGAGDGAGAYASCARRARARRARRTAARQRRWRTTARRRRPRTRRPCRRRLGTEVKRLTAFPATLTKEEVRRSSRSASSAGRGAGAARSPSNYMVRRTPCRRRRAPRTRATGDEHRSTGLLRPHASSSRSGASQPRARPRPCR